jgi:hypothetical protein
MRTTKLNTTAKDRNAAEAPDLGVTQRRARLRDRVFPGGLTLTGFFVAEAVCFGAFATAVLVGIV